MTKPEFRSRQTVQEEVLRRIHMRAWKPGEMIPHEADLAREFGCARATVNRALREIANTGLLERRRKAQKLLRLRALHMADARPYALEDRWINLRAVPEAEAQDFAETSSNEWLLKHAPYTHGEIAFSAANATAEEADALGCETTVALFVLDRMTWNGDLSVTKVRLVFAHGHAMRATL